MSQNPYAQDPGADQYEDWSDEQPRRTSLSAVASVLCSIPCCFVPGMGILGIGLGAASLGFIKQSRGRLSGGPAAITGIFLGLLTSVIWGAIGLGASQAYAFWTNTMRPEAEGFVQDASAGSLDAARARLSSDASKAVADERLTQWIEAVETRIGAVQGVSADLGLLFSTFGEVYGSFQGGQSQPGQTQQNIAPVPFALEGQSDQALLWVLFDGDSLDNPPPKIADVLVVVEGGEAIPLRSDGPAADIAKPMSDEVVPLGDEADQTAPEDGGDGDGAGGSANP